MAKIVKRTDDATNPDNYTFTMNDSEMQDDPKKYADALSEYGAFYNAAANTISKPDQEEYSVPMPNESDYIHNKEWWDTYFPVVSKEDELQRERKAQQAQRWGLFANALTAIGNAVGGAYGGKPVQLAPVQQLDLQTWRNQLNADRRARATAEDQQKKMYVSAVNQWQTGKNASDNAYTRSLNDWRKQVATAAQQMYNADQRAKAREDEQTFKAEQAQIKHQYTLDEIITRMRNKTGKTNTGGKTGGSKGNVIDTLTSDEVNAAYDAAVENNIIHKDYKNSKDVGTKRAALKKAYGKSYGKSSNTSSSTGGKKSNVTRKNNGKKKIG